jgi:hypothetical protein
VQSRIFEHKRAARENYIALLVFWPVIVGGGHIKTYSVHGCIAKTVEPILLKVFDEAFIIFID